MEILGIGPLELLFIMLIALIAVGPRELGKAAQSVGRLLNQLYRSEAWRNLSEASRNLRTLPNRLAREAALEDLDQARKDIQREVGEFASDVGAATDLKTQAGAPPAAEHADETTTPTESREADVTDDRQSNSADSAEPASDPPTREAQQPTEDSAG